MRTEKLKKIATLLRKLGKTKDMTKIEAIEQELAPLLRDEFLEKEESIQDLLYSPEGKLQRVKLGMMMREKGIKIPFILPEVIRKWFINAFIDARIDEILVAGGDVLETLAQSTGKLKGLHEKQQFMTTALNVAFRDMKKDEFERFAILLVTNITKKSLYDLESLDAILKMNVPQSFTKEKLLHYLKTILLS